MVGCWGTMQQQTAYREVGFLLLESCQETKQIFYEIGIINMPPKEILEKLLSMVLKLQLKMLLRYC